MVDEKKDGNKGKVTNISDAMSSQDLSIKMDKVSKKNRNVKREELVAIMSQVVNNINEISKYLMADVNALYKNFVYPCHMRVEALSQILIEKGIITEEELKSKVKFLVEENIKKAKEVVENEQGELVEKKEEEKEKTEE